MSNTTGSVFSVNVSQKKGTIKLPVHEAVINKLGIKHDAHAGKWQRQVTLLPIELINKFSDETGKKIGPGEFAENITVAGLDLSKVKILDRFKIGIVELEVTQIGKDCHGTKCEIFKETGRCIMPDAGIFCRVIKGGKIKKDDPIEYIPRHIKILIITLSDRAMEGVYDDKSGPMVKNILLDYFHDSDWIIDIDNLVIPDNRKQLKGLIKQAVKNKVDLIFTTGGTGIGNRDITPDVVIPMLDKKLPGLMDNIRIKFGQKYPNALLSRSCAGSINRTLVYVLPGSVKAAGEYTGEIVTTLMHSIYMINNIDNHA